MSKLFIVESPNKVKKISTYLGKDFRVIATKGHIYELPSKSLSVNIETFEPNYEEIKKQKNNIRAIRQMSNRAKEIWIATDPDREGEAIGFHVMDVIGNPHEKIKRAVFNSISKKDIQNAIKNPAEMNLNLYHAAKSRRVLDRLIGYLLSPLAWRAIGAGTSIGRCQTPALNIVIENEKNVNEQEYILHTSAVAILNIETIYESMNRRKKSNKIDIETIQKKFEIKTSFTEEDSNIMPDQNTWFLYKNDNYTETPFKHYPPKPFITSTIQQTMNKQNGWSPKKTMSVLQSLFTKGHITYIRTDSYAISPEFSKDVKKHINESDYKPYAVKIKNAHAQEGHEAIRPTNIKLEYLETLPNITRDEKILYRKIWIHAVACHMKSAIGFTQIMIFEDNHKHEWKGTHNVYSYYGWKKLFSEERNPHETNRFDPSIFENEIFAAIPWDKITVQIKPANYKKMWSVGDLLKRLTDLGIGRPSTFSTICDTIINRCYLEKGDYTHSCKITKMNITPTNMEMEENIDITQRNVLISTDIGKEIHSLSKEYMMAIMNPDYTSQMEQQLDMIAKGNITFIEVCSQIYNDLQKIITDMKPAVSRLMKQKKDDRKAVKEGKKGRQFEDEYFKYSFGRSKYGFYVCRTNKDTNQKQYESVKQAFIKKATLDDMYQLFLYPFPVKAGEYEFTVKKGKYGLYVEYEPLTPVNDNIPEPTKKGKNNRRSKKNSNIRTVTLSLPAGKSPMEMTTQEWEEWAFNHLF
jgi:DNA topoisomerase-1